MRRLVSRVIVAVHVSQRPKRPKTVVTLLPLKLFPTHTAHARWRSVRDTPTPLRRYRFYSDQHRPSAPP